MLNLLCSFLAGVSALAADHRDHPSVHGMAVVGEESIYLSHLPMFHSPHDYQVIFEAELNEKARASYIASKEAFAETVYTIAPETFVLPDMVEAPRPFQAILYRGHFERGGEEIARATITIKRVVYFRKFDPQQPRPGSALYFLFGKGKEKFLAHEITAKPDFDQILAVAVPHDEGQTFVVSNQVNKPVKSGWVSLHPQGERSPITAEVRNLYLEEGDLSH